MTANALEHGVVGVGLQQCQRTEYHLFASLLELFGDLQPIGQGHLSAFAAHGFPEIDSIHRPVTHLLIKGLHLFLRPKVE